MCAINGIFAYAASAAPPSRDELLKTRDYMTSRGPDSFGEWWSPNKTLGLGHRRLSIIDLTDGGSQPMRDTKGRYVITFNGEIYNYVELRDQLVKLGYRFRSNSDTEVILNMYSEYGAQSFKRLRGMFSIAIYDSFTNELILSRDPYGIKPLYYCDEGFCLRFASQVKALVHGRGTKPAPSPGGIVGFYLWGSVPEPLTNFDNIWAVPAGSFIKVSKNGVSRPVFYFDICTALIEPNIHANRRNFTSSEASELFRTAVIDSISKHLVSDVPIGLFLSGGIDSGALLALVKEVSEKDIQSVTLSFSEFAGKSDDEAPAALEVSKRYGSTHYTRNISKEEFLEDIPKILEAMDQPTIDGINSWFVSKATKEIGVKVAMSGIGADELLGGYPSFKTVPMISNMNKLLSWVPRISDNWRNLVDSLPLKINPKLRSLFDLNEGILSAYFFQRAVFLENELDLILDPDFLKEGLNQIKEHQLTVAPPIELPKSIHAQLVSLESRHYLRNQLLRDTDWASMAHSLEVRAPFVDAFLLRDLAPLITSGKKFSNKLMLANSPTRALPASITQKSKTGFSTPINDWMASSDIFASALTKSTKGPKNATWARRWSQCVAGSASFQYTSEWPH